MMTTWQEVHMITLLNVTSTVILIVASVLLLVALVFFIIHLIKDKASDEGNYMIDTLLQTVKGSLLIHDLTILVDDKEHRIDFIIIHPHGIFVIETNTYEGVITGRETKTMWTDVMAYGKVKSHIYNPIRENESHLAAIHELLKPIGDYKLQGIVVFLKNAQLFVQANDKALIKPCSIKAYIANNVVQKLSETQMKKIYDFLVEAKIKGVTTPTKE